MTTQTPAPAGPGWITFLIAAACGLIAANLYFAQPLIGLIGPELGLTPAQSGLIVTLTQVGYGLGLLFVVPLGDLFENRRLILTVLALGIVAALGLALARTPSVFLAFCFLIGLGSVSVQILVPLAAHLAPPEMRGRVVGRVMSGLLLGIMLARPASSLVTELAGWRVVFFGTAGLLALLAVVLRLCLPWRQPEARLGYGALIASMGRLVRDTPLLRRRAFYQALMFASFSLFWTTTPLLLAGPDFGLSQGQIALFALAGVAGAIAAPIAGAAADRDLGLPGTALSMLIGILAYLVSHLGATGSNASLTALVAAAVLLDFGVTGCLVFSQRAIYSLSDSARSRLNGIFMATFFGGGALGSALGAWTYAHYGWGATSLVGMACPALALLAYAIHSFSARGAEPATQPEL